LCDRIVTEILFEADQDDGHVGTTI
jgi:hypothetical protein